MLQIVDLDYFDNQQNTMKLSEIYSFSLKKRIQQMHLELEQPSDLGHGWETDDVCPLG